MYIRLENYFLFCFQKKKDKKQFSTITKDTQPSPISESKVNDNSTLMDDSENINPTVMSVDVTGAEFLDKNKPMIGEVKMKVHQKFSFDRF